MTTPTYQWYQCSSRTCLFRCPALPRELANGTCPNCDSPILPSAQRDAEPLPLLEMPQPQPHAVGLLLDNIRSIYNVGSLFRTADGADVAHLFCCGMTATPDHPKVAKTALGAQSWQRWQHHTNSLQTAVSLKKSGWQLWVLEKTAASDNLFEIKRPFETPIVLVVGNERAGVDPALVGLADRVVSLPMLGQKASLNVAVAAGIALYQLQFGDKGDTRHV